MEAIAQDQQISIIENSLEVFKSGSEILKANLARSNKAVAVGQSIIIAIEQNGGKLNPELDERCKNYLANCNKAKSEMNEARKPVTQIMDVVKKMFTESEGKLDSKNKDSIASRLQTYRDQYAKWLFDEQERVRKEAEAKAAKDKEAVDIKAEAERRLVKYLGDYLFSKKTELNESFNKITLSTFEGAKASLLGMDMAYSYQHFVSFQHGLFGIHHKPEEIDSLVKMLVVDKFEPFCEQYKTEMYEVKNNLVNLLPSKLAELEAEAEAERIRQEEKRKAEEAERIRQEEIAKAEGERKRQLEEAARIAAEEERQRLAAMEEERKRTEAARMQREEEERQRLAAEALKKEEEEKMRISMQQQAKQTEVLFEKEAATMAPDQQPEARQGYNILVSHAIGYGQIFQFWFEREGKNLPIDKIGNTKLDQMKFWAEKLAHKTGEKIESDYLKYEASFKAVNRK